MVVLQTVLFADAVLVLPGARTRRWWSLPSVLVLLEAVRTHFPFGGFPVPGLALWQLDGPFTVGAPLAGSLLVVWLAATTGTVPVAFVTDRSGWGVRRAAGCSCPRSSWRPRWLQPRPALRRERSAPRSCRAAAGPVDGTPVAGRLADLASSLHATLVVGVTESAGGRFRNAAVVWGPDGAGVALAVHGRDGPGATGRGGGQGPGTPQDRHGSPGHRRLLRGVLQCARLGGR